MSAPHTSQYLHNKKKTNSKIQKQIENLKRRQTKKFKTINKKKKKNRNLYNQFHLNNLYEST